MRSKFLGAALALVAVLGITTAASATTRWLITGKMIAPHSINSTKLVDHTIQKHDLSQKLVRSLHGAKGARGPVGPQGPAGPQGATGATGSQGATGVVDTRAFALSFNQTVTSGLFDFVSGVVVSPTSSQKLIGSAVAVISSTGGATFDFEYGLCYQVNEPGGQIVPFSSPLIAAVTPTPQPFPVAAAVDPMDAPGGVWPAGISVGYCARSPDLSSVDVHGTVSGWVMVVN